MLNSATIAFQAEAENYDYVFSKTSAISEQLEKLRGRDDKVNEGRLEGIHIVMIIVHR